MLISSSTINIYISHTKVPNKCPCVPHLQAAALASISFYSMAGISWVSKLFCTETDEMVDSCPDTLGVRPEEAHSPALTLLVRTNHKVIPDCSRESQRKATGSGPTNNLRIMPSVNCL